MTRAVIYARYSSASQNEQSIEGQLRDCYAYAARNNMQVVGEYADRAISGRTDDRPEFLRMIDDARAKKFEALIVWKTDRFARNRYDSAMYKHELKKRGVSIHYAAESIPDGPEGLLMETLMEGLAEYFSAELAIKVRRGMRESALKAQHNGTVVPLGYRVVNKKFVVDEDSAAIVRKIFREYQLGQTRAQIARELNGLGHRTRTGKKFDHNAMLRILSNRQYIGVYRWGDIEIEGGVPAIIDREVFDAVQNRLSQENKMNRRMRKNEIFYLTGKLDCGCCGKPMHGTSGRGRRGNTYHYYKCATPGCEMKPIRKDQLEEIIAAETAKFFEDEDTLHYVAKRVFEEQKTMHDEKEKDQLTVLYEKQLLENKKSIDNIMALIESGSGTKRMVERIEELEREQENIKDELQRLRRARLALTLDQIEFLLYSVAHGDPLSKNTINSTNVGLINRVRINLHRVEIYYNVINEKSSNTDSNLLSTVFELGALWCFQSPLIRTPRGGIYLTFYGICVVIERK